jgi:hypothetical protein
MNSQAKQAFDVLNEFISDLVTASRCIEIFESKHFRRPDDPLPHTARIRMCYSHLFLTLAKWIEFYKHFKHLIPSDCHRECKALHNEIIKRGIVQFRNKRVGHIWDKKQNRPWTIDETNAYFNSILSDDANAFLKWTHDPTNNVFPNTVVSILEKTRRRIQQEYSLS